MPIGAMVARYARDYDPAWFYIHVTFQIIGFIFIIAGVATGVNLTKSIDTPGLNGHRGLGLFLFILAILQVCPYALLSQYRDIYTVIILWLSELDLKSKGLVKSFSIL